MTPLVSVIIPCYNAEKWVAEAIDSALSQTYPVIEVIVIDDGSTDNSLEIIKNYGDRIKWETGKNRGQSAARNRGFSLSSGKYIQWLDADDYILPDKIKNQVNSLEESGADIAYGDWRYQFHRPNQQIDLDEVKIAGEKKDILIALLSGFALTILNCLTNRKIVEAVNGFDEELRVTEDIDFWIRAAIFDAKFVYCPGCYSVYRVHSKLTASSKSSENLCNSLNTVLEKSVYLLEKHNKLNGNYKEALAQYHFQLAKWYLNTNIKHSIEQMKKVKRLDSKFQPSGNSVYENIFRLFGFTIAAYLFLVKKKVNCLINESKTYFRF